MRAEHEIRARIDDLMLDSEIDLDEGQQAEIAALLWVLDEEDRWYDYLRTGSFE
jgi:hypothetical protein